MELVKVLYNVTLHIVEFLFFYQSACKLFGPQNWWGDTNIYYKVMQEHLQWHGWEP